MSTAKLNIDDLVEIKLRKRVKKVFKPHDPEKLSVAIVEIWDVRTAQQKWSKEYVVSFGGNKSITIYGEEDWDSFMDLVEYVDYLSETTREIEIVKKEGDHDYDPPL